MNKNARSKRGQVMSYQDSIGDQPGVNGEHLQGIIVPLDLPEREILSQTLQADGSIEVHVKAITDREACPSCGKICVKIHDTRGRVKKDIALRNYQVRLVLYKRRFRCFAWRRTFTEPDVTCGRYKRGPFSNWTKIVV